MPSCVTDDTQRKRAAHTNNRFVSSYRCTPAIFKVLMRLLLIPVFPAFSLPFPEDQFSFPLQERGGQRRGGAFRGPTLRPKGHSGFKCAPCVAGAAIALMQSDRDRCDISVPTHFHTTSHRLGVTHIPLLWSCPPAAGQHDDARMNLAIALTAARYGAAIANYTEVVHLLKRADPQTGKERVCGAHCRDVITGKSTKAASFLPASLSIPHNRGPPSSSYSVLVCT